MDFNTILDVLVEFGFVLGSFGVGLMWAVWFGRQSVINIVCAGYLALFFYNIFPYHDQLSANTPLLLGGFLIMLVLSFLFFRRVMPAPYRETRFESFGKKLLLAAAFTCFVVIACLQFLPLAWLLGSQPALLAFLTDSTFNFWYILVPLILVALN